MDSARIRTAEPHSAATSRCSSPRRTESPMPTAHRRRTALAWSLVAFTAGVAVSAAIGLFDLSAAIEANWPRVAVLGTLGVLALAGLSWSLWRMRNALTLAE